ncbi:MAG TPA: glucokinase [Polyangiaceae bacterium]|nr:glucokinase [Polyangiaceae bacterium]
MIVAADIGGTKTSVALLEAPRDPSDSTRTSVLLQRARYQSSQHAGLTEIVRDFLEQHQIPPSKVRRVCAGIAGPVVEGHVETPNLPWSVNAAQMRKALGVGAVTLMNDLEATAERAATLGPQDVCTLNAGKQPAGPLTNGAVIAAGTGLGMAILHPIDGAWWPVASEGGHMDLAPRNELEMDLLRFLLRRHKRVSVERVLSGPGLLALYEFFESRGTPAPHPEVRAQVRADEAEAPRIVTEAALAGRCPVAVEALNLFVSQYGAAAGNLALLAVSTGGLFVGGGIAPKILPRLREGVFLEAFTNKGRLSPLLESMPVHVILDEDAALLGAARRGVRLELGLVREGAA